MNDEQYITAFRRFMRLLMGYTLVRDEYNNGIHKHTEWRLEELDNDDTNQDQDQDQEQDTGQGQTQPTTRTRQRR